nr:DUF1178 family protein [Sphingomonas liriopis]
MRCTTGHVFEAWFGSSAAYDAQAAAGQVACPLCGDTGVGKAVMAPGIPAKGNRRGDAPPPVAIKDALRRLAARQAKALEGSQWVGSDFATRARAMHDGSEANAPIHGQASVAEAKALVEEGVPVAPLPLPVVPPEKAN